MHIADLVVIIVCGWVTEINKGVMVMSLISKAAASHLVNVGSDGVTFGKKT